MLRTIISIAMIVGGLLLYSNSYLFPEWLQEPVSLLSLILASVIVLRLVEEHFLEHFERQEFRKAIESTVHKESVERLGLHKMHVQWIAATSEMSLLEKVKLIEQLASVLEQEMSGAKPRPRRSLYGVCVDLGEAPSSEDIAQAREEAWGKFPREDIA